MSLSHQSCGVAEIFHDNFNGSTFLSISRFTFDPVCASASWVLLTFRCTTEFLNYILGYRAFCSTIQPWKNVQSTVQLLLIKKIIEGDVHKHIYENSIFFSFLNYLQGFKKNNEFNNNHCFQDFWSTFKFCYVSQ